VHDDIQDGDRTRRGRPTVWALWGEGQAINVGNCLHALAFQCLTRLAEHGSDSALVAELVAELARTSVALNVGQTRDLALETAVDADSAGYLAMVGAKTAALFRCATLGGAMVGAPDDRATARALGHYGHELGLSFQIRDDILGIWGTDAETGKPTGTDIRRRKKTLPVVLALEGAGALDGERLPRLYAQGSSLLPADERYVREVLDQSGVRHLAQERANRHRARAVAALAPFASPGAAALRALADFVADRTH
jgi:geranylgeranyl diphosphate synthase type I